MGRRYRSGEVPAPLPYGVDALGRPGLGARRARGGRPIPAWRKMRDVVEHRAGFPVEQTLRGAREARRSDVVLALLEQQGAAAADCAARKVPPYGSTPLVVWSVLARRRPALGRRLTERRRLTRRFDGADLITHMSRHETEIFTDLGIERGPHSSR